MVLCRGTGGWSQGVGRDLKLVEEDHNISNSIIINLCMYDNSMTLYLLYTISQQAFNKVT